MQLGDKTLSEWREWVEEEKKKPLEHWGAQSDVMEAFEEAIELLESEEAVEVPPKKKEKKSKPFQGTEGKPQEVAVFIVDWTDPVTESGAVSFTIIGGRSTTKQREYEFVGTELPGWFNLLEKDANLDIYYRRYGDSRRVDEVVPSKVTPKGNVYDYGGGKQEYYENPDIAETKSSKKPEPKPKSPPKNDEDAMWG